jgi:hypothetical protein
VTSHAATALVLAGAVLLGAGAGGIAAVDSDLATLRPPAQLVGDERSGAAARPAGLPVADRPCERL